MNGCTECAGWLRPGLNFFYPTIAHSFTEEHDGFARNPLSFPVQPLPDRSFNT